MTNSTIRVLHVIHEMKIGGIETWLLHLLQEINRKKIKMDFLVHTSNPQEYDEEILNLGSQIIPCPWTKQPLRYNKELKRILHEYGPYHIIHSHVHHFSGWVLRTAKKSGIPIRIAHSHNDISILIKQSGLLKKLYYYYTEKLIQRNATCGLAASEQAANSLFGKRWRQDPRWQVLHCGIYLKPFYETYRRNEIRSALNIPNDSFVIGHVGRFTSQKNHSFLIDIIDELVTHDSSIRAILIGEGESKGSIELKINQKGLNNHIILLGSRRDVPRLMMGAMDVFVFPSLWEGLGLALVEAQAAALPCIMSDIIPTEADIVPNLMTRLSLSLPAHTWAEKVLAVYQQQKKNPFPQLKALELLEQSPFNLQNSLSSIQLLYQKKLDSYLANITNDSNSST